MRFESLRADSISAHCVSSTEEVLQLLSKNDLKSFGSRDFGVMNAALLKAQEEFLATPRKARKEIKKRVGLLQEISGNRSQYRARN